MAHELGVCPASVEESFHGLNQGLNAGRICWAVAGTLCSGEVQGSYAQTLLYAEPLFSQGAAGERQARWRDAAERLGNDQGYGQSPGRV